MPPTVSLSGSMLIRLVLALVFLAGTGLEAAEKHEHGLFETDSHCLACAVASCPAEPCATVPAPVPIATYDPGTPVSSGPIACWPHSAVAVPSLRGPPIS